MENTTMKIVNLTDLPNYKVLFTEPLAEFGVKTIEDLTNVLKDEEKKASMISAVKGLGPRTVEAWEKELTVPVDSAEDSVKESDEESPAEDVAESGPEEPQENSVESDIGLPVEVEEIIPAKPVEERNVFCTMEELKGIQRTTIDLLRMNGSKKKGLSASVEYVNKRLKEAGLDVTVNKEPGFPIIIATKGVDGIVFWGHLDTERMDGMKKKQQGEILGDMIHGRGAANMKGAVASMLCAASRLSTWNVPFSIVLTTDALGDQLGAECMSENPLIKNSKGILFLAPTGLKSIIGQPGYAAIKVRISGEGSVMKMAAFLKGIDDRVEDSSGGLSVKTGLVHGGNKKRPYDPPLSCEAVLELETKDSIESVTQMMEILLVEADHKIEVMCQSEVSEFDRASELALVMTELTKKDSIVQMAHTEAAKIVPLNDKIVVFGTGTMASAVTDQEYVTLNELEWTYEVILNLVDRLNPIQQ